MTAARFQIMPSGVFAGRYAIVDTTKNHTIARHRGILYTNLNHPDAVEVCDRLERQAARRKICRSCRHLAPADTITNGRCQSCAV